MSNARSLSEQVLDDVIDAARLDRPVLVQAADKGHHDVLRYLLQRVSPSDLAKARPSAFLAAAREGHCLCLSALLDTAAADQREEEGLLVACESDGRTALAFAAARGHGDCVSLLLHHGREAQLVARDVEGWIPLMWAAQQGHTECVARLLQHSPEAQVAAANKTWCTALMLAADGGHTECIKQLMRHNPSAQVTAVDEDGKNALFRAVLNSHADCVRHLLRYAPELQVTAATRAGVNALHAAVRSNDADSVALLLTHAPTAQLGARVDKLDAGALVVAAYFGRPQFMDLLLAHSPQQQELDQALLAGLQQWHAAAPVPSPHAQCLERLLAKGAHLPASSSSEERDKHALFIQHFALRALLADRANEAVAVLALDVRSKRRKAGNAGCS